MKVLYWLQQFWPYIGGIEVRASQILPALKMLDYEIAVITDVGPLNLAYEDEFKGIAIHRFPFHEALANKNVTLIADILQRLKTLKRAFKPDMTHLAISDPSFFFELQTGSAYSAPLCVSFINSLTELAHGAAPKTLLRRLINEAALITGGSEFVLEQIRSIMPESESKLSLLRGMDVPELPPSRLPFEQPELLCFGRLVKEKGFDTAIAAFSRIANDFPLVKLTVAGDGPERLNLEQLVSDLELEQRVSFTGWVVPEKIPNLLNNSTMVLVPSRWDEQFGNVAVLAGHMARPVVAANSGGLPEIVLHKQTGLIVEREDIDALAAAIKFLLLNPQRAIEMGELARERTTKMFNLEQQLDAHDRLYRQLKHKEECRV